MIRSKLFLLAAGHFAKTCVAQASGWMDGQVNTTMCYWDSPRAAVIRDTLYIDGGNLWWEPGMNDGTFDPPVADGNPLGLVYLLNFSKPFDTTPTSNLSNAFTTISKASGSSGAANNIGPQYYDGAMFANDYDWMTYGGLLSLTNAFKPPGANSIASYQQYPQGAKTFSAGYLLDQLPTEITRYVTNGAAVSVPSENLGFYFGGLRAAEWGPIFYQPGPKNESIRADVLSNTMIEVDMSVQGQETWANNTLPTTVPGRVNAEIVWVPVSQQGVLVAIGGVIDPQFDNVNGTLNATATSDSMAQSPGFMTTVSVFDIASGSWYEQLTSGAPGQMTQGCAVVASAQDGTSHNIYWYGGFDGIDATKPFSDDVWILSIPSFMWMKVHSGNSTHGRAGHRCVKPYPDQMFVIGGYTALPSTGPPQCVGGNIIQIFNLSSALWVDKYNPSVWSNYTVPSMISVMIGGSGTGSATQTAPSPSGFSNSSLVGLFGTPYNSSKIATWYPYMASATPNNTRPTISEVPAPKSGGTPSYLAPVLGVVLGLFFVTLVILAFLLWRRRKIFKQSTNGAQSEAGTLDNRRWVTNWLRATPVDAKAPTVTTDDTPSSPYEEDVSRTDVPEMGDSQVHEMMDTSMPTELHGTGFVPLSEAGLASKNRKGMVKSQSPGSHASQTSSISLMSHISAQRPGISPVHAPRADSPSLGESAAGADGRNRVGSGFSDVSESDRGHIRGISDTSVSTEGGFATPMEERNNTSAPGSRIVETLVSPTRPSASRPGAVSPLTPPHPVDESGGYLAAGRGSPGGKRKSQFSEKLDEVDEKK
ncbi:Kelch repeat-containing protein [Lachnellula suecica]|uniref:Kelch repeat-containing protein n=1 Tax=Lachnellula suecica TaxID=602035 RepID=A0A8T9CB80_9HELO|nr:Kelch repeat-containing protein [Lachnellula suecica]